MSLIDEIRTFLKQRRTDYEAAVTQIKTLLDSYKRNTSEGRRAIYRVASRSDYGKDELKTPESIEGKLEERRLDNPKYQLVDLEDIIGITIVCVHPKYISTVTSHLQMLLDEGKLAECDGELVEYESGYQAWHYKVALPGRLRHCYCEVKVMTMLEEAWAFRTHDLLYKPRIPVKPTHHLRGKLLSEILRAVDIQSEELASDIEKQREVEEIRRSAARAALFQALNRDIKASEDQELHRLWDYVKRNQKIFKRGSVTRLINRIEQSKNCRGIDRDSCRIVAYAAVIRDDDQLDGYTLDLIDEWIYKAVNTEEKASRLFLKALVLWGLSDPSAITVGKAALQQASQAQNAKLEASGKGNIAYFIADFDKKEDKDLAQQYSKEAFEVDPSPSKLDTCGYVKIAFGENPKEVQDGWEECKKSWKKRTKRERQLRKVALAFLLLHQHKALKRLLEYSEKGQLLT